MLLSNTKRRSVVELIVDELINRLIRSKRMLKVRKKLNYGGMNRGYDHLGYTSRNSCQEWTWI
jgi:hypothetical protein